MNQAITEPSSPLPPITRVPAAWIFAGLVGGLALGLLLALRLPQSLPDVLAVAGPVGDLWLRALRATILPLVVALLFTGVAQTVAAASAGALARRALLWFMIVLVGGSAMAGLLTPLLLSVLPIPQGAAEALRTAVATTPAKAATMPGLADFITSMVPSRVAAAAKAAVNRITGRTAHRQSLTTFFEAVAGAMLVVIGWVLWCAPLGVFALSLTVAAKSGTAAIGALAHYVMIVALVGTVVFLAAYPIAIFAGRQKPGEFARAVMPAQALALSTQSSLATLPAMLAACRRLGLGDSRSEFVLPLAVALFRGTGPAMNFAVAIYVAHWFNVPVDSFHMLAGFAVASVMSFGAVSLPGSISFVTSIGPIAMSMGVPVEPLALLVAVEMLPDLMRTLGNVTMDVAVTAAVAARED